MAIVSTRAGDRPLFTAYLRDVSARKQFEVDLRQARDEAEAANRAKTIFLSRMSHELRTPLNAILGFGQLLEMDPLSDDQRDSVGQILRGGRHLLGLINEVLDISRVEAGEFTPAIEEVRCGTCLAEVTALARPLAAQAGVTLDGPGVTDQEWSVLADAQRLRQVLLNLVSNAIKYNRAGGTVTLSCQEMPGRRVRINVADTGRGSKLATSLVCSRRLTAWGPRSPALKGRGWAWRSRGGWRR